MRKNFNKEEDKFYNRYVRNAKFIIPSTNDLAFFNDFIENHVAETIEGHENFQSLDLILSRDGEYSVAIEAFKVDGSNSHNNGSKVEADLNTKMKEFRQIYSKDKQKNTITNIMKYDFSLQRYIKNFIKNFDKHYNNIRIYSDNFEKYLLVKQARSKTKKIGFLIHDDFFSPITFDNGKVFSALYVKELLEYIKTRKHVDFVIFHYMNGVGKSLAYCFQNNDKSMRDIMKHTQFIDTTTVFKNSHYEQVQIALDVNFGLSSEVTMETMEPVIMDNTQ